MHVIKDVFSWIMQVVNMLTKVVNFIPSDLNVNALDGNAELDKSSHIEHMEWCLTQDIQEEIGKALSEFEK